MGSGLGAIQHDNIDSTLGDEIQLLFEVVGSAEFSGKIIFETVPAPTRLLISSRAAASKCDTNRRSIFSSPIPFRRLSASFCASMPTPVSVTSSIRFRPSIRPEIFTSPPRFALEMPCLTAFSTSGCKISDGIFKRRNSGETSILTCRRSSNRAR